MRAACCVAGDVLREAASRKWFLALGFGITAVLLALALGLRMEVVDGALSATRLFGHLFGDGDIQSAEVVLRPVFGAAAYLLFYGGTVFGILSCADFAPSLLSPGRIEAMLALPVRRWELVVGTFLGVMSLALLGALYGAGGLFLLLGWKTGVWSWLLLVAALLACAGFATIYASMVAAALLVRSTAFSALVGGAVFLSGILASFRGEIAPLFSKGFGRAAFEAVTLPLPRIATLANLASKLAAGTQPDLSAFPPLLVAAGTFTAATLALGIWHFESKDF